MVIACAIIQSDEGASGGEARPSWRLRAVRRSVTYAHLPPPEADVALGTLEHVRFQ